MTEERVLAVETAGGPKTLMIKRCAWAPKGLVVLDCRELGTPGSEWSLTHEASGKTVGVFHKLSDVKAFCGENLVKQLPWDAIYNGGIDLLTWAPIIDMRVKHNGHRGATKT